MSNVRCCGIFYEYQSPLLHLSFFSSFITPFLFSLLKLFMPPPLPSYFLLLFSVFISSLSRFFHPPFLLHLFFLCPFILFSSSCPFLTFLLPCSFLYSPSPLSSALISMNIHSLHLSVFLSFSPSVFISCPHFTAPFLPFFPLFFSSLSSLPFFPFRSCALFITCTTNKVDIYTSANHSGHVSVMFPVNSETHTLGSMAGILG